MSFMRSPIPPAELSSTGFAPDPPTQARSRLRSGPAARRFLSTSAYCAKLGWFTMSRKDASGSMKWIPCLYKPWLAGSMVTAASGNLLSRS